MAPPGPGPQSETSSTTGGTNPGAQDSSSTSSTYSDASLLFNSCPHWVYSTSWTIGRPEAQESSRTQMRPVLATSEQMLQAYRLKRLKGSVLLCGLTAKAHESLPNAEDVPASLYRTLAHLFEMSKNGVPYTPIDCEGLQHGVSAAHWARPLWTICEASLPQRRGHHAGSMPATTEGGAASSATSTAGADDMQAQQQQPQATATEAPQQAEQAGQSKLAAGEEADGANSEDGSSGAEDEELDADPVVRLLRSCPSWCYLYSHEPLKSKKTPPKTAAHMLEMYKAGCLPDWAPLLGLREEVAHFNSLPPSLFTTLAALVSVLKAGLELQPVGLVELQRYDKFIECRNQVGSTMRTPSADKLIAAASAQLGKSGPSSSSSNTQQPTAPSDALSPTLSALPPVARTTSRKSTSAAAVAAHAAAAAVLPAESPTVAANGRASGGAWTPSSHTPRGQGGAPSEALEASGPAYPSAMTPPHMLYPTMTPTAWLWGVPHMPFTYLTPASSPMAHGGMGGDRSFNSGGKGSAGGSKRNVPGSPFAGHGGPTGGPGGGRVSPAPMPPGAPRVLPAAKPPMPPALPTQASYPMGSYPQPALGQQGPAAAASMLMGASSSPLMGAAIQDPMFAAAASGMAGMWGWSGYPPATAPVAPMPWTTPLFRLFTADNSRGAGVPAWWYLDRRAPGGRLGPLTCETMILSYGRGALQDHHLVCGTHGDVGAAGCPPPRHFFEELGKLLRQVEEGGEYALVSLTEIMQAGAGSGAGQQPPAGGPRQGGVSANGGPAARGGVNQRQRSGPLPSSRSSNGFTGPAGRALGEDHGAVDVHAAPVLDAAHHARPHRAAGKGGAPGHAPASGRIQPSSASSQGPSSTAHGEGDSGSHSQGGHSHTHSAEGTGAGAVHADGGPQPTVFATQEAIAAAMVAVAAATSGGATGASTLRKAGGSGPVEARHADGAAAATSAATVAAGQPLGSQELSLQQLPELPCSCRGAGGREQAQKCSRGDECEHGEDGPAKQPAEHAPAGSEDDAKQPPARDSRACSCGGPLASSGPETTAANVTAVHAVLV